MISSSSLFLVVSNVVNVVVWFCYYSHFGLMNRLGRVPSISFFFVCLFVCCNSRGRKQCWFFKGLTKFHSESFVSFPSSGDCVIGTLLKFIVFFQICCVLMVTLGRLWYQHFFLVIQVLGIFLSAPINILVYGIGFFLS